MRFKTGLGQDSHRFETKDSSKPCVIGGVHFEDLPGFKANSDGDVVYHAICNAISSITGVLVLGGLADELCLKDGITNSEVYLEKAFATLEDEKLKITHVAISIEGKKPTIKTHREQMKENIAKILNIDPKDVGITATSGEGLSDYGCGDGVQAFCVLSVLGE